MQLFKIWSYLLLSNNERCFNNFLKFVNINQQNMKVFLLFCPLYICGECVGVDMYVYLV